MLFVYNNKRQNIKNINFIIFKEQYNKVINLLKFRFQHNQSTMIKLDKTKNEKDKLMELVKVALTKKTYELGHFYKPNY